MSQNEAAGAGEEACPECNKPTQPLGSSEQAMAALSYISLYATKKGIL